MKRDCFTIENLVQQKGLKTNFNKNITTQFEKITGLLFEPNTSGEVCFAESQGIRNDFKTHFTVEDLMNYCYAVLNETENNKPNPDKAPLPYPKNNDQLWNNVQYGKTLRK